MSGDAEKTAPGDNSAFVLFALFSSVLVVGVAFAGIVPWMSLALERRGVDPTTIGIVAAASPIGIMIMAPFVGRAMQILGTANSIMLGAGLAALTILLLPVFDGTVQWIVLRFIGGLASALPWVATETWINTVASSRSRGRVVAVYVAFLSLGYSGGPLVLSLVGVEGWRPVLLFVALELLAIVPTFAIRSYAPRLEVEARLPVLSAVWAMPAVFGAAYVAGMVDTGFLAFLPIWGLRVGLDHGFALLLLTVFIAGNVVLPLPAGWLADRFGTRPVMALCGAISIVGPMAVVYAMPWPVLLGVVLFIWGGAAFSLYSLAMTDIGHHCRGTQLAAASGALVVVYTISNIAGPPVIGAAMDAWGPHALMAVSAGIALLFMALLALTARSATPELPREAVALSDEADPASGHERREP